LPAAIAVFGLFSLFQGLRMGIGIVVGAPYVFDIFSVLFLLVTLVFADGIGLLAAVAVGATAEQAGKSRGYRLIAIAAAVLLALAAIVPSGYATNSPYLEMLLFLCTLCIVFVRYCSPRLAGMQFSSFRPLGRLQVFLAREELFGSRKAQSASALVLAFILASVLALGAGRPSLSEPGERPPTRQSLTADAPVAPFNVIAKQRGFDMARTHDFYVPPNMADHIRNHLPPMQTWFGGHTLPVVALDNQYAITLTVQGLMNAGFILNNRFLADYFGASTGEHLHTAGNLNWGDLSFYLGSEADMERLVAFLQASRVRYIITRPAEEKHLDDATAHWPRFATHFSQLYRNEGFRIYRLTEMPAAKGLQ
jgi:hypothetical protein